MKYKLRADAPHPEEVLRTTGSGDEKQLSGGLILGPHETVDLNKEEAGHPHNLRLIEEELLVPADESEEPEVLEGQALRDRGKELGIENYSKMPADELRAKIAEKEKEGGGS